MSKRKLVLIDDDDDDQEIFLSAISEISDTFKCEVYADASEALELLVSKTLNPEVIFLDLNMPKMNGQQFLTELKSRDDLADIPVIIFSTSSHPSTIEELKKMGAKDFFTKPGNYDELVDMLSRIFI
jgi:DNA-binding NtrC family response regulator